VNERRARAIVDTSVVIDLERIDPSELPGETAVSAVTLVALQPRRLLRPREPARDRGRTDDPVTPSDDEAPVTANRFVRGREWS
jgi:hypothetical protein